MNASDVGIRAILSQDYEDGMDVTKLPVAFAIRSLKKAEFPIV